MFGTVWGYVHLPCHGDVSQDDLWSMLKEMEDVVVNLRCRHHSSRIVIGCDVNVSLAPSLEVLSGSRIHPNANGASSRWREAVIEWMHSFRLRALCTSPTCWMGPCFQLDAQKLQQGWHLPAGLFACFWACARVATIWTVITGRSTPLFVWSAKSCGVLLSTTSSRSVDGHPKLMRRNESPWGELPRICAGCMTRPRARFWCQCSGKRLIHEKLHKTRHSVLSFDGARRLNGLGAVAWIRWFRDEYGSFEKSVLRWTCAEERFSDDSWTRGQANGHWVNIWQFCFRQKLVCSIIKLKNQVGQHSTNLMRSLCVSSVFTVVWVTRIALVRIISKTNKQQHLESHESIPGFTQRSYAIETISCTAESHQKTWSKDWNSKLRDSGCSKDLQTRFTEQLGRSKSQFHSRCLCWWRCHCIDIIYHQNHRITYQSPTTS